MYPLPPDPKPNDLDHDKAHKEIHARLCSVVDFGAKGDGVTDDTAALNNAWNALSSGGTLKLPAAVYAVANPVLWQNKERVRVDAFGAVIKPQAGANFDGKPVLDLGGTRMSRFYGVEVRSELLANKPGCLLALYRTASKDGAINTFYDCYLEGTAAKCLLYNVAAEVETFNSCYFASKDQIPLYLDTPYDDAGLVQEAGSTSNTRKHFNNCFFMNNGAAPTNLIAVKGWCYELTFRDCHMAYYGSGSHAVHLEPASQGSTVLSGLILDGVRVEVFNPNGSTDDRLVYIPAGASFTHSRIVNTTLWTDTAYALEFGANSLVTYSLFMFDHTSRNQQLMRLGDGAIVRGGAIYAESMDKISLGTGAQVDSYGLWLMAAQAVP